MNNYEAGLVIKEIVHCPQLLERKIAENGADNI